MRLRNKIQNFSPLHPPSTGSPRYHLDYLLLQILLIFRSTHPSTQVNNYIYFGHIFRRQNNHWHKEHLRILYLLWVIVPKGHPIDIHHRLFHHFMYILLHSISLCLRSNHLQIKQSQIIL